MFLARLMTTIYQKKLDGRGEIRVESREKLFIKIERNSNFRD